MVKGLEFAATLNAWIVSILTSAPTYDITDLSYGQPAGQKPTPEMTWGISPYT